MFPQKTEILQRLNEYALREELDQRAMSLCFQLISQKLANRQWNSIDILYIFIEVYLELTRESNARNEKNVAYREVYLMLQCAKPDDRPVLGTDSYMLTLSGLLLIDHAEEIISAIFGGRKSEEAIEAAEQVSKLPKILSHIIEMAQKD